MKTCKYRSVQPVCEFFSWVYLGIQTQCHYKIGNCLSQAPTAEEKICLICLYVDKNTLLGRIYF